MKIIDLYMPGEYTVVYMRVVTKQSQAEQPEVIVYSFNPDDFMSGLQMLSASLAAIAERKGLKGEVGDVVVGMNTDGIQMYCVVTDRSDGVRTRDAGGACAAWAIGERLNIVEMAEGVPEDFVEGFLLRNYVFSEYKTVEDKKMATVASVLTASPFPEGRLHSVRANHAARDFMNEPPNALHPARYAEKIQTLFADTAVSVEVLGEETLEKLGMRALLAVGRGSAHESKVVVMRWQGGQDAAVDLALVGKGVTFDTGGISLKPGGQMDAMRWDMGGSAAVVGALYAAAKNNVQCSIVGVVGLVENMPDGSSYRPGDIVTSMSGKTIEIINTDAEGRMVLADALWYVQERFSPCEIIDFATLTGAIVAALGAEYGGLFTNNTAFAERLVYAGERSGEPVWHMPIHDNYIKRMKSRTADLRNMSVLCEDTGAGTAAAFLREFIKKDSVWAHIDIAGCAFPSKHNKLAGEDPSGFGARFIHSYLTE